MLTITIKVPENKNEALSLVNNAKLRSFISNSTVEFVDYVYTINQQLLTFATDEYGITYDINNNTASALDESLAYELNLDVIDLYNDLESFIVGGRN